MIDAPVYSQSARSVFARLELFCDRLAQAALAVIAVTVLTSIVLGVLAIVAWPQMRVLGNGPGGGSGIPAMLLMLAVGLGVPSFLMAAAHVARGEWGKLGRILPLVGPAFLFFTFFFVSHAFDPCALELASFRTTVFGTPLCQPWGGGWEIATRFHLLHHAVVPTVFVAYGYWLVLKRWHPAGERFGLPARRA